MAAIEIRAFEDEHLAGAAESLARCHRAHLKSEPLLADDVDFESLVSQERVDATGAVALSGTSVVGYLLGRHATGDFGEHIWSTSAGQAADDPSVLPDLYAAAAATWVERGLVRHFVFAPAD